MFEPSNYRYTSLLGSGVPPQMPLPRSTQGWRRLYVWKSTESALLLQKEITLCNIDTKNWDLEKYGIRGSCLDIFHSYLSQHNQAVVHGKLSALQSTDCSVPQGSLLGLFLFHVYINDIINISSDPQFILYADDTHTPYELIGRGNAILEPLSEWSRADRLYINTKKTKAVFFRPVNCVVTLVITLCLAIIEYI